MGIGVWEGLQSIGNGRGLQMDGFSAHFEPSDSISVDFLDFGYFGVVSDGLTLFPEGPRTVRGCPEGPRTLCESVMGVSCYFRKVLSPSERVLKVLGPCASVLPDWS